MQFLPPILPYWPHFPSCELLASSDVQGTLMSTGKFSDRNELPSTSNLALNALF